MVKIFKKYKITTLINLSIFNISNNSIDDAILSALKNKYEGKVTKYGYIQENSIEIIKRSAGISMKEHFNSSFNFKAICYALICNPSIDTILNATITSSNNAGFKAEVKDDDKVIIDIIIPRLTAGIKHEYDIEDLEIGKEVYVKICRKRYHFADTKIVIIGLVINDPNSVSINDTDEVEDLVEKIENKPEIDIEEELEIESDNEDNDSVIDLSEDVKQIEHNKLEEDDIDVEEDEDDSDLDNLDDLDVEDDI